MRRIKSVLYLIVLALICSSCEKVINIKLDDSTARIVIEGEVNTSKGPYKVTVTESKNFDENNTFPGRNDAVVMIKDLTVGTEERLTNVGSGGYVTATTKGKNGHAYQLTVTVDGKTYTATSTIPLVTVKLEKLYARRFVLDKDKIFMVPVFTDPAGKGNYYRIRQWVNDVPVKGSFVRSDDAADGQVYDLPAYYDTDDATGNPLIHVGDHIKAELQNIDKSVYDYFRTLSTTVDQNSSDPSNPLTNISGGALGVFNACSSTSITTVAKL